MAIFGTKMSHGISILPYGFLWREIVHKLATKLHEKIKFAAFGKRGKRIAVTLCVRIVQSHGTQLNLQTAYQCLDYIEKMY